MSKVQKTVYVCRSCGGQQLKWAGQCAACGEWNTLDEERLASHAPANKRSMLKNSANIQLIGDVASDERSRYHTGLGEFDRVLGGGLVQGSIVLIGGDPGIGKSTLLLQVMTALANDLEALYVTGEESLQQVSMRSNRLGISNSKLKLYCETQVEEVVASCQKLKPRVLVVDSIQTVFTEALPSAPGSVAQVRECAMQLVRFAKETGTCIFLVGHVTKEGALAGPRILEHMVDTVLYFEGENSSRYRLLRAVKNRFGAVNELGIFAMTQEGLLPVNNPSAIFLSRNDAHVAGSIIVVTQEGSRPLLVEIQALVTESQLSSPRRVAVGLDQNRLNMLLAILQRHGGIPLYNQDIFVNVVGGVKVNETATDLAVLLAVISSLNDKPIAHHTAVFGEIGLAGEVRPVQNGQERIAEAVKHGFKRLIIPPANSPRVTQKDADVIPVKSLVEAIDKVVGLS